jgi:hypothetical protein
MAVTADAVRTQNRDVPFLSVAPFSAAAVRGYVASIEGYLWRKNDGVAPGLRERLGTIKADGAFRHFLGQRENDDTAWVPSNLDDAQVMPLRTRLLQLDHIALDIKSAAGQTYLCTPVTVNVPKDLTRTTQDDRALLSEVIGLFKDSSCADGEADTQTVANLPAPQKTYRIDREKLSAAPAPRYWTYRLQKGGETNGGILMETGVDFVIADLRAAFLSSLQSVALKAQGQPGIATGHYVRCSAPDWLRRIVAA